MFYHAIYNHMLVQNHHSVLLGLFLLQNAWSGGYIAGTSIGKQAVDGPDEEAAADGYERPTIQY
ncbi:hypothetical protein GBA52_025481 [Prunus armeniaca]|nr:hypothetical protein GBA52_025481 [Prunus armeniaca]